MLNPIHLFHTTAFKTTETREFDGLIKLCLAIMLSVLPLFLQSRLSFISFFVYLLFLTFLSRIKPRTLLISASSYLIIVLMPYLFGLALNGVISHYYKEAVLIGHQTLLEILLRLLRLFIIWFISILYFQTTSMRTVLGLVEKLLRPLRRIDVPVEDYLKVIMCAVLELKSTGSEIKKNLEERMRMVMSGTKGKSKLNIKGIAEVIVLLIVHSFERLDKVEDMVNLIKPEDIYHYRFNFARKEGVILVTAIIFLLFEYFLEKGIILGKV